MTRFDCVIVGGGITGLSAAFFYLQRHPQAKIALIEKQGHLGGKVHTHYLQDFVLENSADCFLSRKKPAIDLCAQLNLTEQLIGRNPEQNKTYVKFNGKLYPLPAGITGLVPTDFDAIEQSQLISAEGKARFRQETEIPAANSSGDESIASFMTRRFGQEIYEKLIEPLMAGIYGGDGNQLSLQATFKQLQQIEQQYGSLTKGLLAKQQQQAAQFDLPPFVSFEKGMTVLVNALEKAIDKATVALNTTVESIEKNRGDYQLYLTNQKVFTANKVILCTPAFITSHLLKNIDPQLMSAHQKIPYGSTALVNLAYKKSEVNSLIKGYGYVIPKNQDPNILATTFTSQKWTKRAPEDKVLIRVYMNRFSGEDVLAHSDEKIVTLAQQELAQTVHIDATPVMVKLVRCPNSMPQYVLGHTEAVSEINQRLQHHANLAVAGAAYNGVGIPDCIASANQAVATLA